MFDFSKVVDRHGTWCTQWDYVADRFGSADLLPFTISDMDFATAPCILEALTQRLSHGVLGYSRWKNDEFLAAISHWFLSRHNTHIDPQSLVYGPSVIYMVSELIRQWSSAGDAVVIHTPAYDAFTKQLKVISAWCALSNWKNALTVGTATWPRWRMRCLVQRAKFFCSVAHKIRRAKCGRVMSWKPWQNCVSAMV